MWEIWIKFVKYIYYLCYFDLTLILHKDDYKHRNAMILILYYKLILTLPCSDRDSYAILELNIALFHDFRYSIAQGNSGRNTQDDPAFRAKHKKWSSFWNYWEWRTKFCSRLKMTWVSREETMTTTTRVTTVFRLCNNVTARYYASVIWTLFVLKFILMY